MWGLYWLPQDKEEKVVHHLALVRADKMVKMVQLEHLLIYKCNLDLYIDFLIYIYKQL